MVVVPPCATPKSLAGRSHKQVRSRKSLKACGQKADGKRAPVATPLPLSHFCLSRRYALATRSIVRLERVVRGAIRPISSCAPRDMRRGRVRGRIVSRIVRAVEIPAVVVIVVGIEDRQTYSPPAA